MSSDYQPRRYKQEDTVQQPTVPVVPGNVTMYSVPANGAMAIVPTNQRIEIIPAKVVPTSTRAVSGVINSLLAIFFSMIPLASILLAGFSIHQIQKAVHETGQGEREGHGISILGLYTSTFALIVTILTHIVWVAVVFGGAEVAINPFRR